MVTVAWLGRCSDGLQFSDLQRCCGAPCCHLPVSSPRLTLEQTAWTLIVGIEEKGHLKCLTENLVGTVMKKSQAAGVCLLEERLLQHNHPRRQQSRHNCPLEGISLRCLQTSREGPRAAVSWTRRMFRCSTTPRQRVQHPVGLLDEQLHPVA